MSTPLTSAHFCLFYISLYPSLGTLGHIDVFWKHGPGSICRDRALEFFWRWYTSVHYRSGTYEDILALFAVAMAALTYNTRSQSNVWCFLSPMSAILIAMFGISHHGGNIMQRKCNMWLEQDLSEVLMAFDDEWICTGEQKATGRVPFYTSCRHRREDMCYAFVYMFSCENSSEGLALSSTRGSSLLESLRQVLCSLIRSSNCSLM